MLKQLQMNSTSPATPGIQGIHMLCAEYKGADLMKGLALSRSQVERLVLAYKVSPNQTEKNIASQLQVNLTCLLSFRL